MTYAERHVARAFELAKEFVKDKVRQDVQPDMVYRDLAYHERGRLSYRDRDAWLITMQGNTCLMALDADYLTTVIEGKLKLSSRIFGGDRSKASSYGRWKTYWERQENNGMDVDMANAIIETLGHSE